MVIQSSKSGKIQKDDCLAIFKPGLWRSGFLMRQRMVPFLAATNGE